MFYSKYPTLESRNNLTGFLNISQECKDQYLCPKSPQTSTIPTTKCEVEIREKLGLDPPKHQLQGSTSDIMWATICFILVGGIVQTIIGIWMACRSSSCSVLPTIVKVVMVSLCPILMGPVVVYAFLIIQSTKGIKEDDSHKFKLILGYLKMGEVFVESIPQLVVNAWSLLWRCGHDQTDQDHKNSAGHNDPYRSTIYSTIGITQGISIITSILGISYAITDWVIKVAIKRIAKGKMQYFASEMHYPGTSFMALFVWTLISLLSYVTGVINLYGNISFNDNDASFMERRKTFLIMFFLLILRSILLILIFSSACFSKPCCGRFKIFISITHLVLVGFLIGFIAGFTGKPVNIRVIATLTLFSAQLLLGALILPSPNFGMKILNPIVKVLFNVLNEITCGKLHSKINEWRDWKGSILEEGHHDNQVEDMSPLINMKSKIHEWRLSEDEESLICHKKMADQEEHQSNDVSALVTIFENSQAMDIDNTESEEVGSNAKEYQT